MNIIEMLKMHLEDNNINCYIPKSWDPYGSPGDRNTIIVHLSHTKIAEGVSISVSKVLIDIKDSTVWGSQVPRRYALEPEKRNDPEKITALEDPNALRRITGWIKKQEIKMRNSAEAQQAFSAFNSDLMPSQPPPEAPGHAFRDPASEERDHGSHRWPIYTVTNLYEEAENTNDPGKQPT